MSMNGSAAARGAAGRSHTWPPTVYFVVGGVCALFWFGGTSIQVLTSESWFMHLVFHITPFAAYFQVKDFVMGNMNDVLLFPFIYAWTIQLASVCAAIGIELPRHPAWRYWGAWGLLVVMIAINSGGDWNASSPYGQWGQAGFTGAILFLTFFVGFAAVHLIVKGIQVYKGQI